MPFHFPVEIIHRIVQYEKKFFFLVPQQMLINMLPLHKVIKDKCMQYKQTKNSVMRIILRINEQKQYILEYFFAIYTSNKVYLNNVCISVEKEKYYSPNGDWWFNDNEWHSFGRYKYSFRL